MLPKTRRLSLACHLSVNRPFIEQSPRESAGNRSWDSTGHWILPSPPWGCANSTGRHLRTQMVTGTVQAEHWEPSPCLPHSPATLLAARAGFQPSHSTVTPDQTVPCHCLQRPEVWPDLACVLLLPRPRHGMGPTLRLVSPTGFSGDRPMRSQPSLGPCCVLARQPEVHESHSSSTKHSS